jgi:predicted O-methyltransferase YrrM
MATLADFLNVVFPRRTAFLKDEWIQGQPVRHVFMLATCWALARSVQPQRPLKILEVGVWMGASCLTWAEGLDHFNNGHGGTVTGIDPLTPYFDAAEFSRHLSSEGGDLVTKSQQDLLVEMDGLLRGDFVYDLLMHNMRTIPAGIAFEMIREPSGDALPTLADRRFDLVYIDGSHSYGPVKKDLEWAARLVEPGGIVCGDDLELQLDEVDPDFARAHAEIDFPTDPKTGSQFHPGVTLAVAERFGRVANFHGFWGVRKVAEDAFEPLSLANAPLAIPNHLPESVKAMALEMLRRAGLVR